MYDCFVSAGVAEWLGSGLQLKNVSRNPLMLVRIQPPAPNYTLVKCEHGDMEVMCRW